MPLAFYQDHGKMERNNSKTSISIFGIWGYWSEFGPDDDKDDMLVAPLQSAQKARGIVQDMSRSDEAYRVVSLTQWGGLNAVNPLPVFFF